MPGRARLYPSQLAAEPTQSPANLDRSVGGRERLAQSRARCTFRVTVRLSTWAREWTEPFAAPGFRSEPLGEGDACPNCRHAVLKDAVACPWCGRRYVPRLATKILTALTLLVVGWSAGLGLAYPLFRVGYDARQRPDTASRSGTGEAISDAVNYILMVGSAALALGALVISLGVAVESSRGPKEGYGEGIDAGDLAFRVGGPFLSLAALCLFGVLGCGIAALFLTGV